ncbi:hypothetical protein BDBG_16277 [Blastomyces gilchristii SLH14081]|uniref:Uncharacterized protein n=1 Tax=Blastomyces gilchristii (strain SLH14081) TaxID=559298 RepID=A0A179UB71_BLAGS|nr:uncharacterized protein BDBG_16277 [Blastomyces gilchristii SLH14081]OAT04548.1 hypothetical protein BDBG_16277 [Blastomyces gilchristii SLH14081]
MNVIWLLSLLFLGPFLLFLAFLVLTSCLGDSFRARIAGFSINPREAIYDRSYLRTMTNSGSAMSEQIELEDMLRDRADGYDSDDAL